MSRSSRGEKDLREAPCSEMLSILECYIGNIKLKADPFPSQNI